MRATVLDQHDRPPPLGGEILLQVQGPGVVGRTGGASGYAFIDVTGAAGFDVACSDAGTLQLMAAYEGAFGFLPWHIECGTLPGDWQIFMDIESSRPVPGQVLAVTIDVVDGSGDPVPSGTRITLEVTSGDFLWFPTLVQILTVQTHGPSGRIVQSLVTPDSSGTALVCARFSDERLGDEMCRGVVVAW